MFSNGIPMFRAGDEFMNTQYGNDNPCDQDNEMDGLTGANSGGSGHFPFLQRLIAFRKVIRHSRSRFERRSLVVMALARSRSVHDAHSLAFSFRGNRERRRLLCDDQWVLGAPYIHYSAGHDPGVEENRGHRPTES